MTPQNPAPVTAHLPNGLATVEQEIARACKVARRERASVTLIAVSKTFDAAAISPVIDAGQHVFGENRVQEAKAKWPGLMSGTSGIGKASSSSAGGGCELRGESPGKTG